MKSVEDTLGRVDTIQSIHDESEVEEESEHPVQVVVAGEDSPESLEPAKEPSTSLRFL